MLKTSSIKLALAIVLLFSVLAGTTSTGAAPKSALTITITADRSGFTASEAVLVNVTIANIGQKPVKVLKWYTPIDDMEESLFKVTRDGVAVDYVGPDYKRLAPTGSDYVNLKPGESFTRTIDLGQYYDLSASGVYQIEYNDVVTALASNEIELNVEGRSATPLAIVPEAVTGNTSFRRCTTSQQNTLIKARTQASTYATGALSYLSTNKTGSRYTTWFGVYLSTRYSTATNHFSKISGAMDTASVTFDCSCKKKNVYAYVYANQPYVIYLCGVFWNVPLAGTDSQGGTLIHEISHFTVVAGTSDYVYGQSGAKSLAISDPNKAVNNADNHEYFAENNPALP